MPAWWRQIYQELFLFNPDSSAGFTFLLSIKYIAVNQSLLDYVDTRVTAFKLVSSQHKTTQHSTTQHATYSDWATTDSFSSLSMLSYTNIIQTARMKKLFFMKCVF